MALGDIPVAKSLASSVPPFGKVFVAMATLASNQYASLKPNNGISTIIESLCAEERYNTISWLLLLVIIWWKPYPTQKSLPEFEVVGGAGNIPLPVTVIFVISTSAAPP